MSSTVILVLVAGFVTVAVLIAVIRKARLARAGTGAARSARRQPASNLAPKRNEPARGGRKTGKKAKSKTHPADVKPATAARPAVDAPGAGPMRATRRRDRPKEPKPAGSLASGGTDATTDWGMQSSSQIDSTSSCYDSSSYGSGSSYEPYSDSGSGSSDYSSSSSYDSSSDSYSDSSSSGGDFGGGGSSDSY